MKSIYVMAAAFAASQAFAATELRDCVIQEVIPGKHMTGAFLTFVHSGEAVEIASADIPSVTANVELHNMVMKGDVMEMGPLEDLTVSEGERVFKKGGDHLMLMEIPDDKMPKAGEFHTITVHFSNGESATCKAEVKTVEAVMEAAKMAGGHKDGHAHSHAHGESHGEGDKAEKKH